MRGAMGILKDLKKVKTINLDGFFNAMTGLGDPGRDKRKSSFARSEILDYQEQTELYRGSFMAAKGVELIANEMTREWLDVRITDDPEAAEALTQKLDEMHARERWLEAMIWERTYGGAAIFMAIDDGQLPDMPVNEKAIRQITALSAFDRSEVFPIEWENNAARPNYGEPTFYRINPRVYGMGSSTVLSRVHASRIIRFKGIVANRTLSYSNQGWGDSVLDRAWTAIADCATAYDGPASLLNDIAQAVFKVRGLSAAIASDKPNLIRARLAIMDQARSLLRAIVIDAEKEDFSRQATPMTGVAELQRSFALQVAAAFETPISLLMGESPAGLMATGDTDVRFFYDSIRGRQRTKITPDVRRFVRLLMLSKGSATKGLEPKNWSIEHRSLWQMTDAEKAKIHLEQAQADQINVVNGVLTPEEVRQNRFEKDTYSVETSVEPREESDLDLTEPTPRVGEGGDVVPLPAGSKAQPPAPAGAPGAPAMGGPAAGGGITPQDTAFTGIQVTSGIGIVEKVAAGKIPRESGLAALEFFYNMTTEQAEKLMGNAGNGFEPKEDPLVTAKAEALANPPAAAPGAPGKPTTDPKAKPPVE